MLTYLTGTHRVVLLHGYGGRNPYHKESELLYSFSIFPKPAPSASGKLAIRNSQNAAAILTPRK